MAAPLNVDKEQVRMLVLSVGVREAARRCGIKEGTVQDWSAKGKWLAATRPTAALLPPPASMVSPTSPTKPADALVNALREDSEATRKSLSRAVRKTAEHAESLQGKELMAEAPNIKATIQGAALLHAWDAGQDQGKSTIVNVNLIGVQLPDLETVVDV